MYVYSSLNFFLLKALTERKKEINCDFFLFLITALLTRFQTKKSRACSYWHDSESLNVVINLEVYKLY